MTEEAKSIVVVNNLIATDNFNALLASTMDYYLTDRHDISVNFVRHTEIVCSLGLMNIDEMNPLKISTVSN
jgi:hypothetical protein